MQLLVRLLALLCGVCGTAVRGDGFLPVADAREDMGRHVLGVRRRWRDLGISLGGVETFLRYRRVVVEVNEVMSDAWVPRLPLEDRLQDGGPLSWLA